MIVYGTFLRFWRSRLSRHILPTLASIRQLLHCELCQAQQESHDGGQWPRSSQGNSGGQLLRAMRQHPANRMTKTVPAWLLLLVSSFFCYRKFATLNPKTTPNLQSAWTSCQEHPKLGVYVKGLYHMPCETKQDVMGHLEKTHTHTCSRWLIAIGMPCVLALWFPIQVLWLLWLGVPGVTLLCPEAIWSMASRCAQ